MYARADMCVNMWGTCIHMHHAHVLTCVCMCGDWLGRFLRAVKFPEKTEKFS